MIAATLNERQRATVERVRGEVGAAWTLAERDEPHDEHVFVEVLRR